MLQIKKNAHVASLTWAFFTFNMKTIFTILFTFSFTHSYGQQIEGYARFNNNFEFDTLISLNIDNSNKVLVDHRTDSIYLFAYSESTYDDIYKLYRLSTLTKKIDSISMFIPNLKKLTEKSGSFLSISYNNNRLCLLNFEQLIVYDLLNAKLQTVKFKTGENYRKCKIINNDSVVIYWTDIQRVGRQKNKSSTVSIYSIKKVAIVNSFVPFVPFGEFNGMTSIKLHDINDSYFLIGNPLFPSFKLYDWSFKLKQEYMTSDTIIDCIDTTNFKLRLKEAGLRRDFGFVFNFIYEAYLYKYSISDNYNFLNDSEIQIRYTPVHNDKDSFVRIYDAVNFKTGKSRVKYWGYQSLKPHKVDSINLIDRKSFKTIHVSLSAYIISNSNFSYCLEGTPVNPIGYDELTFIKKQNEYLKLNEPTFNIYILKSLDNVH